MNTYGFFSPLPFHFLIVVYFFLGGVSGGAFLFSVFAKYFRKELAKLSEWGFFLPLPVLALGMLLLTVDLGRPERFYTIMLSFQPTSAAWWGTWILSGFGGFNFLYVLLNQRHKVIAYLGGLFALGATLYSGVLLYQMLGRPLWHSPLTILSSSIGALLAGSAAILLLGVVSGKIAEVKEALPGLGKILAGFIAAEILLIVVEVFTLFGSDRYAQEVARGLLRGNYAVVFLGGQLCLGLFVPLLISLSGARLKNTTVIAVFSLLLLFGGFLARYVLINAVQGVPVIFPGRIL